MMEEVGKIGLWWSITVSYGILPTACHRTCEAVHSTPLELSQSNCFPLKRSCLPLRRQVSCWITHKALDATRNIQRSIKITHRQFRVGRYCDVTNRKPKFICRESFGARIFLESFRIKEKGHRPDVSLRLTRCQLRDVLIDIWRVFGWIYIEVCEYFRCSIADDQAALPLQRFIRAFDPWLRLKS